MYDGKCRVQLILSAFLNVLNLKSLLTHYFTHPPSN